MNEGLKISDIVDPMELSNSLVDFKNLFKDEDGLKAIMSTSEVLVDDILGLIGDSPEAIRGACIALAQIQALITEVPYDVDEEILFSFFRKTFFVGFPFLIMSFLSSQQVVRAKKILEGGTKNEF